MGLNEIFMAFPEFINFSYSISGSSSSSIIFALCLSGWTATTRIVRAETLKQKLNYITAAVRGISFSYYKISYITCSGLTLFISTAFFIASTILIESSLSYLGFGSEKVYLGDL